MWNLNESECTIPPSSPKGVGRRMNNLLLPPLSNVDRVILQHVVGGKCPQ